MSDILRPKTVPVVDRLRRRMEKYRAHHDDCGPRFEHSNNGLIEQQKQDTLLLRQRYIDSKAKKSSKKSDKSNKQQQQHGDGTGSNKLHKRQYEEIDLVSTGGSESFEPPSKMSHCGGVSSNGNTNVPNTFKHSQGHQGQHQSQKGHGHSTSNQSVKNNEALTKFSLEIVHQVELTSGGGPNSLQNVTVKTLTNTNLKSGGRATASPGNHSGQSPVSISMPTSSSNSSSSTSYTSSNTVNIELKQDQHIQQSSGFDDLDQCAAALEKDAANPNGSIIATLMMGMGGDGTSDGMIPSDTLKDLISEISDLNPDFLGDYDFEEDRGDLANLGLSGLNSNSTNHIMHDNNMVGAFAASNHGYGHGHLSNNSHTPPVAPVTPTATTTNSSPRLSHVKHEASDHPNSGYQNSLDNSCGNRGLSHCAGPSPAAASTASPLASQLNSHHPSQTPPYSGSAMFDCTSPSGAQGHPLPTSGSSTPNSNSYCPPTRVPTPSSGPGSNSHSSKGGSGGGSRIPYTSPSSLVHDSPAAQTLKQMAEQHQHKTQLGMTSYKPTPGSNPSPARSPFNGDSYCGGFNGNPGDFNSSGTNGPSYPNPIASRNHSGVGGSDSMSNMNNNMNIKQEHGNPAMFNSQQNFPPMDMNSTVSSKRNIHSQPQQPQHKSLVPPAMLPGPGPLNSPNPANRMTNPNLSANHMMQQQQQQLQQQLHPPLHPNKSFTHPTNSATSCHLGGPSANISASHMGNSQISPFMGRPQPNASICPSGTSNYSPTSHHNAYNHSQQPNTPNHPSIQMSQSQQISMSHSNNTSGSLQVSASGAQQLGMSSNDMKGTNVLAMQQQQQSMSYYQNVPSHPQQMHSSTTGVVDSNGPFLQNQMSSQTMPNNPPNGSTQQGQTINFTQQHLRMSTGISVSPGTNNLNRMIGAPPSSAQGPPGPINPNTMNPRMSIAPRMAPQPGMAEMGMNQRSTMDIQQRMMLRQQQQHMRSQAMQQQVGMMMRPPTQPDYKPDMMPSSQTMVGQSQSQAVMMGRFNPAGSGPGRPTMTTNPQMSSGHRMSQQQQQQQQNHMYQQHQQQQQQLQQVQGIAGSGMPQHMSNINMNNMNIPMRRMPSYHSNTPPNPGQISGNINSGSRNSMMATPGQPQPQPNMGSLGSMSGVPQPDWMAMQHERNFSMQQQQQQSIRSNPNGSGYHQGMAMQMSQQQHTMGQMPMGSNVGMNSGMMPGNPMTGMSYSQQQQQQQHVTVSGNGNNMFSQPMNIKMSQSQSQSMCLGSNFAMRNGSGMAISNSSTGSGGTLIQSTPILHSTPGQTNHPQQTNITNPAVKNEGISNQNDFSFDLLENITGNDVTGFGGDADFLSSFEANSNYQLILDSL